MVRKKKLYCYVDETGQDTLGDLFIVSVVITEAERHHIIQLCEKLEKETGEGHVKWIRTQRKRRVAFIERVLQESIFQGKLRFAI